MVTKPASPTSLQGPTRLRNKDSREPSPSPEPLRPESVSPDSESESVSPDSRCESTRTVRLSCPPLTSKDRESV